MKFNRGIFLVSTCSLLALAFLSCKKIKKTNVAAEPVVNTEQANGLPANMKDVSGYLYASYRSNTFSGYSYNFFATFSDPGKKLTAGYDHYNDNTIGFSSTGFFGNIDVGMVNINNSFSLQRNSFNPNVFYSYTTSYSQPLGGAWWITEGNLSFTPLDVQVARGFPALVNTATFSPVSKSAGYTINLPQYVSNFDSVVVTISDNSSQNILKKKVGADAQSVTYTPSELSPLYNTSNGYIYLYAYNYTNQVINNKTYLYELSAKMQRYITINP